MYITIHRSTLDGCHTVRRFKSLDGARKYAVDQVGPQDCFGGHYAVSDDGVVRITWVGVTREDLFRTSAASPALNKVTAFYARGNDLFCRQAGYTYDHLHQKFGRIIEVMDSITGDNHDGFRLRHNEGEHNYLFDEEAKFATREAAMASAKQAMLDYISHLNSDEGY